MRRAGAGFLAVALCCLVAAPVQAFDPLAIFAPKRKAVPEPSPSLLPYTLAISGLEDAALRASLEEASLLFRLQTEPPETGHELLRRAEADLPRLIDALWGNGYYAGRIRIRIGDELLGLQSGNRDRAAARAEQERARAQVPVTLLVETGPLYRFGDVRLLDPRGAPVGEGRVPRHLYRDLSGAAARSETLGLVAAAITGHIRRDGHPFARITDPEPLIDHRSQRVGIELVLEEGPRAAIGTVNVTKSEGIDKAVILSHVYLSDDRLYAPQKIADMRRSISRIEAVGSVRVHEAGALAADGSLPLDVEVSERPRRVLGGSLAYSNVDGPALRAYWAHRNLFGGAERLRLEGDLFYLANSRLPLGRRGNHFRSENLGGRLGAGFVKPALAGSRVDFIFDAHVTRNATPAYSTRLVNAVAAFRHRFADKIWVQAGVEGEFGQTTDMLGRMTYRLVGLPVSASMDTTDHDLDPKRGFRVSAALTPYLGFGEVARTLMVGKFQISAYRALDAGERIVLAGKAGLGSISGGSIREIPGNRRFFAGGGGSVRGYEYRSLGPRNAAGQQIGGRSMFEASLELRIRVTEIIGIVPFVDVGTAFASSLPDFDNRLRIGAGLGLRYHTPIGPIRLDVATPLERRKGEKPVALYISLGQAF